MISKSIFFLFASAVFVHGQDQSNHIKSWNFPGDYCVGWVYETSVPDEPLVIDSRNKQWLNSTAMEHLVEYTDPTCAKHIVENTMEVEYYEQFANRTTEKVNKNYLASYLPDEQGRGILNRFGLQAFTDLGDPHLLARFSEFVGMSYCDKMQQIVPLAQLNMRVGNFKIDDYETDYRGKVQYFIATNQEQNLTALVLRGSDNFFDAMTDFSMEAIPVKLPNLPLTYDGNVTEGKVHKGFLKRYLRKRDELARKVKKILKFYNGETDFVIVGHSLGAAWAFLEAVDLVVNQQVDVKGAYLYGMPLVGNQVFVDAVASAIGPEKIFRVVNMNDMVVHTGFPNGAQPSQVNERFVVRCSPYFAVRTCNGGHDPTCSAHYKCLEWTWRTHSEFGDWSLRDEFCRMNQTVPSSVYERGPALTGNLLNVRIVDMGV